MSDEYVVMPVEEQDRLLSSVTELSKTAEQLEDPDVNLALAWIIHIMAKPDVPANRATPIINFFAASSAKFKMQAKYYMLVGKGENNAAMKKNLYMSLSEETEKVAQALKYTTRVY
ncbi:hypothetical protein SEA_NICEHOUSE_95 [Rhodococcus phage NiceHouse]|nr:hypothetical protein SEA_NICEHOUSE_95 [Rhodococcus phage NiceHouse]